MRRLTNNPMTTCHNYHLFSS